METKGRHFILKHEKCGGFFTVNSEKFTSYVKKRDEIGLALCPSCGEKTLDVEAIKNLLKAYRENEEILAENGYSIREIKEPIEPENLLTIVNILKL